jgi:hypothetical protein
LAGFFQPILCSVPDQSIFFVLSKPFNRHGSKIRSLSNDREQSRTIYRERSRTTFGRSSDGNTADLELVETAGQPSDDGCYENGKPGFWNMGGFGIRGLPRGSLRCVSAVKSDRGLWAQCATVTVAVIGWPIWLSRSLYHA